MIVSELIEALSKLDPTLPVTVRGYEGGVNDIDEINKIQIVRDCNYESYYGQHESAEIGKWLSGRLNRKVTQDDLEPAYHMSGYNKLA